MANPQGRPSSYTDEIADKIIERMVEGESLRKICKDQDMPNASTVLRWVGDERYADFRQQYARAMEARADAVFEESFEIADDGTNDWIETNDPENPGYRLNGEHVQRSRLRVDYRKWAVSKMAPKKYGDLTKHELTGADGGPIAAEATVVILPSNGRE